MSDAKKEQIKERGYSALDFGIGALVLGLFAAIVAVSYTAIVRGFIRIFPSLKKDK